MFPFLFPVSSTEIFYIDDVVCHIPKCNLFFDRWNSETSLNTFGGKDLIDFESKPAFAELAVMHMFINSGWDARWLETYGRPKLNPFLLQDWNWLDKNNKNQKHIPINDPEVVHILNEITAINGNSYSGCRDVVAWKVGKLVFAACKKTKKDSIRPTQIKWLKSCLEFGLKPENFLVVQWDFKQGLQNNPNS